MRTKSEGGRRAVRVVRIETGLLGGGIHELYVLYAVLLKGFWTSIIVDDRHDATRINNSTPEGFSDALRVYVVARLFLAR
jgi:hypothetical protein